MRALAAVIGALVATLLLAAASLRGDGSLAATSGGGDVGDGRAPRADATPASRRGSVPAENATAPVAVAAAPDVRPRWRAATLRLRMCCPPCCTPDPEDPTGADPCARPPDAHVEVTDSTGQRHAGEIRDDGFAEFTGLPPGGFFAVATAGDLVGVLDVTLDSSRFLREGRVTAEGIGIGRTWSARVRGAVVRDEDGAPVPGAEIEVWRQRAWAWRAPAGGPPGGGLRVAWPRAVVVLDGEGLVAPSGGRIAVARADAEGRFDLPSTSYGEAVIARAPGRAATGVDLPRRDVGEIEVRLVPSGTLRGTVVDPDGAPLAGAGVFVFPGDAGASVDSVERGTTRWDGPVNLAVPAARTDVLGRYELHGVPVDTALLLVADARGVGRSTPVDDAWIRSPGEVVERDLRVPRWPRLEVRWSGPRATGEDVLVASLAAPGQDDGVVLRDIGDGRFVTDPLPPGSWRLRITHHARFETCGGGGWMPTTLATAAVEAAEGDSLVLALAPAEPGASARDAGRGSVRRGYRRPGEDVPPDDPPRDDVSDSSGTGADANESGDAAITRRVTVRVEDAWGAPLPGASISRSGLLDGVGDTDDAGHAVLDGAPREEFPLRADADGYARVEVLVPAGTDETEVRMVLPRLARVRGTVRAASGRPVPNLLVVFSPAATEDPDDGAESWSTDARGRYDATLPAGRWNVRVHTPGEDERPHGSVEVAPGEERVLDLRVE